MDGPRAITCVDVPSTSRGHWWRNCGAVQRWPAFRYLRGLTLSRVGMVLLICAILTVRQQSLPYAETLAKFVDFLARQFLFALPMLFAVTIADNATARARPRVRVLALCAAVLFGAGVYGL